MKGDATVFCKRIMTSFNAITTNHEEAFRTGPFPNNDLLKYGSSLLGLADFVHCSRVCRAWRTTMELPDIWLRMFNEEKIPCIQGRESTAYQDFCVMFPITYSQRKISCLGRFVGNVPVISKKAFDLLKHIKDPYEPLNEPEKKMRETFSVIVEPTHIDRPYDQALLKVLVKYGDFDAKNPENYNPKTQRLLIPYSLKNLRVLAENPLPMTGRLPVFCYFDRQVLKQCSTVSKTVTVSVMRREVPVHSRNLILAEQKKRLKKDEFEMVTARTRFYFNVLEVQSKYSSCWNRYRNKNRWIFSRTSDVCKINGVPIPVIVGEAYLGNGTIVYPLNDYADGDIGAVPCLPAKLVRPLAKKN